ncbi:MAG: ABC transporter ATP-binding protein [Roseibium sp.]|uniref:ABC transporter ATP-binding protein n=1 Tax=Roseibium sp. TaxID=1936156 RepID=UPI002633E8BB|nr:ABC transporter ATP-binding protein [Roseibium sp.]MCV0426816.1 ABC transporter ATP-binding protein [Roseibium sp.]
MLTVTRLKTSLIGPIDLSLEPGSCTTVSGPSGAGKSLFLRAITDLDESAGTVSLNGRTKDDYPAPLWRKKIAYVPAESGWWAEKVRDHFVDSPDLPALLASVGLQEALSWEVSRLSTGERQRLALVRALQLDPQVLLLDEPTSALDPASVAQVEALLKTRVASGNAILLVTHDPEQPARLNAIPRRMVSGRLLQDQHQRAAQ